MIYFACPVLSDPDFEIKRKIIEKMEGDFSHKIHLPLTNGIPSYEDTETNIKKSLGFIADLTAERPSVYFELGIALGYNIKIKVLAIKGTRLHQTPNIDVHYYDGIDQYVDVLRAAIYELTKKS